MKYVHHSGRATPLQHARSCLAIVFQTVVMLVLVTGLTYFVILWLGQE